MLHGKALVIDSRICVIGSFNWSRASLSDNYEFASYIEYPRLAQTLLDNFNRIPLKPEIPLSPMEYKGVKLPMVLSELFTNHSEKAFDLYLYLTKKAQGQGTGTLKINYEELSKAIGYTSNYFFNIFQPLNKLNRKYHLIQRKPWSKTLTLTPKGLTPKGSVPEVMIPNAYWDYGLDKKLSFPAKYMFLVSLAEAQKSLLDSAASYVY